MICRTYGTWTFTKFLQYGIISPGRLLQTNSSSCASICAAVELSSISFRISLTNRLQSSQSGTPKFRSLLMSIEMYSYFDVCMRITKRKDVTQNVIAILIIILLKTALTLINFSWDKALIIFLH